MITFGCSHTYGHGLADCHTPKNLPGPRPSAYAWPAHLSRLLGRLLDNQSRCGASSKEMMHKIFTYDFRPDDVVVCLWTHIDRNCILDSKGGHTQLLPSADDKLSRMRYKYFHNHYDVAFEYISNIYNAQNWLKKHNVESMHFFVDRDTREKINNFFPLQNLANSIDITSEKFHFNNPPMSDKALDKRHMGPRVHKWFAKKVYKTWEEL